MSAAVAPLVCAISPAITPASPLTACAHPLQSQGTNRTDREPPRITFSFKTLPPQITFPHQIGLLRITFPHWICVCKITDRGFPHRVKMTNTALTICSYLYISRPQYGQMCVANQFFEWQIAHFQPVYGFSNPVYYLFPCLIDRFNAV